MNPEVEPAGPAAELGEYEARKLSGLVRDLHPLALIRSHLPAATAAHVTAEAERQIADLDGQIEAGIGQHWKGRAPLHYAGGVLRRLCEKRLGLLRYLGRPVSDDEAREHCGRLTLRAVALCAPPPALAELVRAAEGRAREYRKKLDSGAGQDPAYRQALARTAERYEKVIPGRLAEVGAALPAVLDVAADALRAHWLETSDGLKRYLERKARLTELDARAEFVGKGAAKAEAAALRSELGALKASAQAEAEERLRSLRDRLSRGDLGAIASILAAVEAHPGGFPPGTGERVRAALADALAGVDAVVFGGLDYTWPPIAPAPAPSPPNSWEGEGPSRF